ncbi:uncharacterized protein F5147DRAFT_588699 [Suillus discolor]|uniref:GATA-type domain-containing protein n=1 Tax=Suillus discolor TaxID=1912936 RepID=A0A9P7ER47_9AGAM|nr:uncharacterized protein F5147DRAFT_588699 [Suillus discolor]KAG2086086.1 hypothetical protein F5147DRAFT_588699 [Suillus discolor]
MPSIVNLKFKGNKSFVAFSNLSDTESLTKTWKVVCTKVASYLEQGQRLENLSWRLWHLQNLMVDTDNAKSKREFKKLSKNMGDKLDKEKGRAIESLEAPDFKRNASTDLIRQRAVERERSREASQNARPGTIKRMQFTFSIDAPPGSFPATSSSSYTFSGEGSTPTKPDLRPSVEFREGRRRRRGDGSSGTNHASSDSASNQNGVSSSTTNDSSYEKFAASYEKLHFPPIFSTSFGPTAILYSTPTLSNPMSYGEGVSGGCATGFSIYRPTIELPLDELLGEEYDGEDDQMADAPIEHLDDTKEDGNEEGDVVMRYDEYNSGNINNVPTQPEGESLLGGSATAASAEQDVLMSDSRQQQQPQPSTPDPFPVPQVPSHSHTHAQSHPRTRGKDRSSKTPTNRPVLTVQTSATKKTGKATLTAPGGVKAECSNCGATHTPLWRRGLNDELNCNACGLYCKLHKRPRPKSMRASHGEGRRGGASSLASALSTAQCYNCHTTATPLWRKDDEGKTVCNACGLYYKLHGSARPISMKSDIIRKRSRHDCSPQALLTRLALPSETPSQTQTPSASPGVSRRPTPSPSPILAARQYHSTCSSELMGALGDTYAVYNPFPGPYHPDYLSQNWVPPMPASISNNANTTANANSNSNTTGRTAKRRRMSTDSVSEPPSSAVSYSSYGGDSFRTGSGATSAGTSSSSRRSSMDFPFFSPYTVFRGNGNNAFWHHSSNGGGAERSPQFVHPPMLPEAAGISDAHAHGHGRGGHGHGMDFLHPPMMLPQEEESLFATYLHPPMILPQEGEQVQHGYEYGQGEYYETGNMQQY